MQEPKHVGTWVVAATPQGDLIKWGKDGDTEFPFPPDDEEAVKQARFITKSPLHKYDRIYILQVFDNGQMATFEFAC